MELYANHTTTIILIEAVVLDFRRRAKETPPIKGRDKSIIIQGGFTAATVNQTKK